MGITNKAISKNILNIIIRTNHGQTEIVIQYGDLRSSVTCVTISCSNDSFASPTLRTNRASRSSCSVSGGEHAVYRVHPINVQLVTDTVIMPAKEELGCDSGSESLDNREPRDILDCHVERRDQSFAVAERE